MSRRGEGEEDGEKNLYPNFCDIKFDEGLFLLLWRYLFDAKVEEIRVHGARVRSREESRVNQHTHHIKADLVIYGHTGGVVEVVVRSVHGGKQQQQARPTACVRACVWINIDFVNPVTNRARGEETREDDPCHGQAAPCLRVRCA